MFGLDVDTLRDIRLLFKQFLHIEKVLLYGSRAKGNYRKGSDIDITLIGKGLNLDNVVYPLMRKLDDFNLPYTFDISIFNQLDNFDLIDHILRVGKTFYEREDKNFPTVKLGDICKIIGGGTPSTSKEEYWSGSIPWITPKDFSNHTNRYISKGARSITLEGLRKSSAKKLPKNTVLLSTRAPIGYVAIAKNVITTNQGFKNLVLKKECIPEYIYYILKSKTDFLNSLGSGTTFKELSGSKIKEIEIPLPPLVIQKQIVATLDKAFEVIDKAIKNTETNLKSCQELFDSYLANIFNNTNKNWEEKKLKDVIKLEYGKPLQINARSSDGKFPVYGANGIKTRTNKFLCNQPSIIIGRKGSAGEITLSESKFWPLDVTYYTVFDSLKYNLKFLFYYMAKLDLTKLAKGVKPGINRNDVYNLKIKIPPLSAQKEIVNKFDILNKNSKKLKNLCQKKLENLKALKKSILRQAFNYRGKKQ